MIVNHISALTVSWRNITVIHLFLNYYMSNAQACTRRLSTASSYSLSWRMSSCTSIAPKCSPMQCSASDERMHISTVRNTCPPMYGSGSVRLGKTSLRSDSGAGETLTESLHQLDGIKRTKDAMAAWRVLVANITDQLRSVEIGTVSSRKTPTDSATSKGCANKSVVVAALPPPTTLLHLTPTQLIQSARAAAAPRRAVSEFSSSPTVSMPAIFIGRTRA